MTVAGVDLARLVVALRGLPADAALRAQPLPVVARLEPLGVLLRALQGAAHRPSAAEERQGLPGEVLRGPPLVPGGAPPARPRAQPVGLVRPPLYGALRACGLSRDACAARLSWSYS